MPNPKPQPRGFVLLLVILLGALLSAGLVVSLIRAEDSANVTAKMLQKKRAFYAADGMQRSVTELAQSYLSVNPEPTQAELDAYFDTALTTAITPPGFTLESFTVASSTPEREDIPNGPFRGMSARQIPFEVSLRLRNDANQAAAEQSARLVLGQLAVFQFYVFSDTWAEDHPGPAMQWSGRAHSNPGWCLGGGNLTADWVTSAGPILLNQDSRCKYTGGGTNFKIRRSDTSATVNLLANGDNGCTNCGGGGQAWPQYALDRFNEQLLDEAHGVTQLKLPISGEPFTQAGWAANVRDCAVDNTTACRYDNARDTTDPDSEANSRFVVDPYLPSVDTDDIREQKFAFKADVRIIDGVWYVKEDGFDWPGRPVWSDHPGSYQVQEREGYEGDADVGHRDLQSLWGTNLNDVPDRFSYYGTHQTGTGGAAGLTMTHAAGDPLAVVSYGPLARKDISGDLYWYPGQAVGRDNVLGADARTRSGTACDAQGTTQGPTCTSNQGCVVEATSTGGGTLCTNTSTSTTALADHGASLLNGVRSGFRDAYIEKSSLHESGGNGMTQNRSRTESNRSRILPMNFDVAAFQAALRDCTTGELGSYFPTTCNGSGDREFNGIVYIGSTWPGQMEGLGQTAATQGHPQDWPYQGATVSTAPTGGANAADLVSTLRAANQPDITVDADTDANDGGNQNQALPYNMCSSTWDGATNTQGRAGWCYNGETPDGASADADPGVAPSNTCLPAATDLNGFRVPRCDDYLDYEELTTVGVARGDLDATLAARVNAIRVINTRYVNPKANRTTGNGTITVQAGTLPYGLTIATNLPSYVLGQTNIETNVAQLDETASDYHFVPVLFAGDRISVFTDAWDDNRSRWNRTHELRNGVAQTFNAEVFIGWTPARGHTSGGIHNLIRHHERLGGTTYTIRGSIVIGFASVFNQGSHTTSGAYSPPTRNFGYDFHLESLENQPPGAPTYTVSATKEWSNQ